MYDIIIIPSVKKKKILTEIDVSILLHPLLRMKIIHLCTTG